MTCIRGVFSINNSGDAADSLAVKERHWRPLLLWGLIRAWLPARWWCHMPKDRDFPIRKVGARTEGAATAPAPGVTTMGLGQSALVMGAEGISSSEISMSSPEDCCPCRESKGREVRGSLGSQTPRFPFPTPEGQRSSLLQD